MSRNAEGNVLRVIVTILLILGFIIGLSYVLWRILNVGLK